MLKTIKAWYYKRSSLEKIGVWMLVFMVFYGFPIGIPNAQKEYEQHQKAIKEFHECLNYNNDYHTNKPCFDPTWSGRDK